MVEERAIQSLESEMVPILGTAAGPKAGGVKARQVTMRPWARASTA